MGAGGALGGSEGGIGRGASGGGPARRVPTGHGRSSIRGACASYLPSQSHRSESPRLFAGESLPIRIGVFF